MFNSRFAVVVAVVLLATTPLFASASNAGRMGEARVGMPMASDGGHNLLPDSDEDGQRYTYPIDTRGLADKAVRDGWLDLNLGEKVVTVRVVEHEIFDEGQKRS